jgi:hypothetical protein
MTTRSSRPALAFIPVTVCLGAIALAVAGAAHGSDGLPQPDRPWAFSLSALYGFPRNDDQFGILFGRAQKDTLHIGARYNYEAPDSASMWAGRRFAGGEGLAWSVMPMLGVVFGDVRGAAPGVEVSLAWRRLDFYIEAEYVLDASSKYDSYLIAWSELAYSPRDWLRVGVSTQRLRVYRTETDLQRGPFLQLDFGRGAVGAYVFDPGTDSQVAIVSLRLAF